MSAKTLLGLLLASFSTGSLALGVAPASLGPPLICHPIDIGEAESLPFGNGRFEMSEDFPIERVPSETVRILGASDDAQVHMETIRRAVIYLSKGRSKKSERRALVDELLSGLDRRVEGVASIEKRKAALRFFDRGYAIAAFRQMSVEAEGDFVRDLEEAIARRSEDPALRFGVSLATYGRGEGGRDRICLENLDKALAGATDPGGLLRRNLVATVGTFLGQDTYEGLVRETRERLARL